MQVLSEIFWSLLGSFLSLTIIIKIIKKLYQYIDRLPISGLRLIQRGDQSTVLHVHIQYIAFYKNMFDNIHIYIYI